MSRAFEALKRIETIFPFNTEHKSNYYTQFLSSVDPFYNDFNLIKQALERLDFLEYELAEYEWQKHLLEGLGCGLDFKAKDMLDLLCKLDMVVSIFKTYLEVIAPVDFDTFVTEQFTPVQIDVLNEVLKGVVKNEL